MLPQEISKYITGVLLLEQIHQTGSIKQSSKNMKIDASTVTHQLKSLEQLLHKKLHQTTTKGTILTDAGLKLMNENIHRLNKLQQSFDHHYQSTQQKSLRFFVPTATNYFLSASNAIKQLTRTFEDYMLTFDSYKPHELQENGYHLKYKLDSYDIISIYDDYLDYISQNNWHHILNYEDHWQLAASRQYLASKGINLDSPDSSDLVNKCCLIQQSIVYNLDIALYSRPQSQASKCLSFNKMITTNDLKNKLELIKNGHGVGTLPNLQPSIYPENDIVILYPKLYSNFNNMLILCHMDSAVDTDQRQKLKDVLIASWQKYKYPQS